MWPTTLSASGNSKLIKWLIAAGALVIAAGIITFFSNRAYNSSHLHVTATRPDAKVASAATNVIFWYNRPISADTAKNFSITPKVDGDVTVKGTALIFTPKGGFVYGTKYTAKVSSAASADGKYNGGGKKINFTIGYVPADQLPKDVQARALALTDSQPSEIAFDGTNDLIGQGVTSAQVDVVKKGLTKVLRRIKNPTDYFITIEKVEAAPYDPSSPDPVSTYNFTVLLNDGTYKGQLDSKPFGTTHFYLRDGSGKLIYDSGDVETEGD